MLLTTFLLVFLIDLNTISALFDNEINLECFGIRHKNVTLTAYYPDFDDEDYSRKYLDQKGNKLMTLQEYVDDRSNYVTLAMDPELNIPYGTPVCIPELNKHYGHRLRIEVRDTSANLNGKGFQRADICVRSEIDSYDVNVNSKVTLVFQSNF